MLTFKKIHKTIDKNPTNTIQNKSSLIFADKNVSFYANIYIFGFCRKIETERSMTLFPNMTLIWVITS